MLQLPRPLHGTISCLCMLALIPTVLAPKPLVRREGKPNYCNCTHAKDIFSSGSGVECAATNISCGVPGNDAMAWPYNDDDDDRQHHGARFVIIDNRLRAWKKGAVGKEIRQYCYYLRIIASLCCKVDGRRMHFFSL